MPSEKILVESLNLSNIKFSYHNIHMYIRILDAHFVGIISLFYWLLLDDIMPTSYIGTMFLFFKQR